jgi:hypothetical protein
MISNIHKKTPSTTAVTARVEALRLELLRVLYELRDHPKARAVAAQLGRSLAASPEYGDSIRCDEVYSLLAEVRGDLAEAARCREAEIRKILELHSLSVNSPAWEYVARQYDFSDVSDRLDLLAILYDKLGDTERAITTLVESKQYCESHGIPFDGADLLAEFESARDRAETVKPVAEIPRDVLDKALRASYRKFRLTADEIVVDDRLAREFAKDVRSRLPGDAAVSLLELKRRLLTLGRRTPARGGLPKLAR